MEEALPRAVRDIKEVKATLPAKRAKKLRKVVDSRLETSKCRMENSPGLGIPSCSVQPCLCHVATLCSEPSKIPLSSTPFLGLRASPECNTSSNSAEASVPPMR